MRFVDDENRAQAAAVDPQALAARGAEVGDERRVVGDAGSVRVGLARGDFLTGLVGFNAGVELGQLSVIALAFLAVGWMRNKPSYRTAIVIPASVAIAIVALVWTIQRTIG